MDKPFIHLIETINGYYVFEVNKNHFISVEEDVYQELEKVMSDNEFKTYTPYQQELFRPLQSRGYL